MVTFLFCLFLWIPSPTQAAQSAVATSTPATTQATDITSSSTTTQAALSKPSAQTIISPSVGPTEKIAAAKPLNVLVMLLSIVICGLLGGGWNYLRTYVTAKADAITAGVDPTEQLNRHLQTCLLGGVVAGGIVPFVLKSVSSALLDTPSTYHYFVFGSYCLAAAVSSSAFIEAAAGSLVDKLKDTQNALAVKTIQNQELQNKKSTLKHIAMHAIQAVELPETPGTPQHAQQLKTLKQQLESVK